MASFCLPVEPDSQITQHERLFRCQFHCSSRARQTGPRYIAALRHARSNGFQGIELDYRLRCGSTLSGIVCQVQSRSGQLKADLSSIDTVVFYRLPNPAYSGCCLCILGSLRLTLQLRNLHLQLFVTTLRFQIDTEPASVSALRLRVSDRIRIRARFNGAPARHWPNDRHFTVQTAAPASPRHLGGMRGERKPSTPGLDIPSPSPRSFVKAMLGAFAGDLYEPCLSRHRCAS